LPSPSGDWRRLWLPVLLYALLIFGLSSVPNVPAPPGPVTDKQAHFVLFAGLSVLVVRALAAGRLSAVTVRVTAVAVLLTILYGASDELHQYFVPGRQMSAADLLADALGAAASAGLVLAWAIIRRQRRTA
jgi:VanZ family protein